MKKLAIILFAILFAAPSFAQFEKGKTYLATRLSGLDLSYNSGSKFKLNLDVLGGHFFFDEVMFVGILGYEHTKVADMFRIGVGARYYIRQNGLHVGATFQYRYDNTSDNRHNNWLLGPEIGYTFFLNRHVTIEPSIYYNMSLNNFSGDSEVGLRLAFGYFFSLCKPKTN
ncbi:MAG: hypothetical protein HUK01_00320 [Bacteroidaceae bacterium]|nr:hypothetical protein [Bacteroidaceae bacterium]